MDVLTDYSTVDDDYVNKSAGLVRTARKIASGEIFAHLAEVARNMELIYLAIIAFCSSLFTAACGPGEESMLAMMPQIFHLQRRDPAPQDHSFFQTRVAL